MSETPAHLARIPEGIAPGLSYVRIASAQAGLLDAHPVTSEEPDGGDAAFVGGWLAEHPDDTVWVYTYDGDSGRCVGTLVLRAEEGD